jgi:FkbM family methyltransferase
MSKISRIKPFIPIPRISPISTFPSRTLSKFSFLFKKILMVLGSKSRLSGARVLGFASDGNAMLMLNKSYVLGSKGAVFRMPLDRVIFKSVCQSGKWEIEESRFLAAGLVWANHNPESKVALVDIGANSGIVSIQSMNLVDTNSDLFLFEPLPKHFSALRFNLGHLKGNGKVTANEFALGDKDETTTIFTQLSNYGNSSLVESVVPASEQIQTEIKVVDAKTYAIKHLAHYSSLVIKCDTQGMDPLILSRIPESIWDKVNHAVVEIWALPEIEIKHVERLIAMWSGFQVELEMLSPIKKRKVHVSLPDLKKIWLEKSYTQGNLYLTRLR